MLLVIGIGLVLYLSWVPNPDLGNVWFVPSWLAQWTDQSTNGNLRTGVPFIFLGLCAGLILSHKPYSLAQWGLGWLLLIGIAVLAEAGQLLIPSRFVSWSDIGWGTAGATLGLLIVGISKQVKNSLTH